MLVETRSRYRVCTFHIKGHGTGQDSVWTWTHYDINADTEQTEEQTFIDGAVNEGKESRWVQWALLRVTMVTGERNEGQPGAGMIIYLQCHPGQSGRTFTVHQIQDYSDIIYHQGKHEQKHILYITHMFTKWWFKKTCSMKRIENLVCENGCLLPINRLFTSTSLVY